MFYFKYIMKIRIVERITYEGEEYCKLVENQVCDCCDNCIFSELCSLVLENRIPLENSPLDICSGSKYPEGYYIDAEDAFMYSLPGIFSSARFNRLYLKKE